jgi:predicted GNAT family acetyltransferase
MDSHVTHVPDESRYELTLDGEFVGWADYRDRDGVRVFTHAEVAYRLRGNGIGDVLMRGTLDAVRESGERVAATCGFVRQFLREHADEYGDLVDPEAALRLGIGGAGRRS